MCLKYHENLKDGNRCTILRNLINQHYKFMGDFKFYLLHKSREIVFMKTETFYVLQYQMHSKNQGTI